MKLFYIKNKNIENNNFKFISIILLLCIVFYSITIVSFAESINSEDASYPGGYIYDSLLDNLDDKQNTLCDNCKYILGGRYDTLIETITDFEEKNPTELGKYCVHYLIAKEALVKLGEYLNYKYFYMVDELDFLLDCEQNWGPSIIMTMEDYHKTRSFWSLQLKSERENKKALNFINDQLRNLIYKGNFDYLLDDEITYIKSTFPGKYDQAICQVYDYIKALNFQINNGLVSFNNPNECRIRFVYKI